MFNSKTVFELERLPVNETMDIVLTIIFFFELEKNKRKIINKMKFTIFVMIYLSFSPGLLFVQFVIHHADTAK